MRLKQRAALSVAVISLSGVASVAPLAPPALAIAAAVAVRSAVCRLDYGNARAWLVNVAAARVESGSASEAFEAMLGEVVYDMSSVLADAGKDG